MALFRRSTRPPGETSTVLAHSNSSPPLKRSFCGCICIGRGPFLTRPFVLVVCPLVREIQSPPLHKNSLHLRRFANIQCMLLLRIVRIHKAQGQAMNGIGWDDNTERLLEPWGERHVACDVGSNLKNICRSSPQRMVGSASYSPNFSQKSPFFSHRNSPYLSE